MSRPDAQTVQKRLAERGFIDLATRISLGNGVTLDDVLTARRIRRGTPLHRARVGLWIALTDIYRLSATEAAHMTGFDPTTVASALAPRRRGDS